MKRIVFLRKKVLISAMICLALLSASCKKDDYTRKNENNHSVVTKTSLVAITDSLHLAPTELVDRLLTSPDIALYTNNSTVTKVLLKSSLNIAVNRNIDIMDSVFMSENIDEWEIKSFSFTYNSVSVQGEPIILSARVTFPCSKNGKATHRVKTQSLYSHEFCFSNDWAPSLNLTMLTTRVMFNSALIEPDYQGLGVDNMKHHLIIISNDIFARQMSDCITAAQEIMRRHNVILAEDGYTTNWGNSMGICPALGYTKYYDTKATKQERNDVRLRYTFLANGPIEFGDVVAEYANAHIQSALACELLMPLAALSPKQMSGYSSIDFFSDPVRNSTMEYNNKTYNFIEALAYNIPNAMRIAWPEGVGFYASEFLNEEMTNDDGSLNMSNPKTIAFLKAYKDQHNLDGYRPVTTIYWAHCVEDDAIPYRPCHNSMLELQANAIGDIILADIPYDDNVLSDFIGGPHMLSATLTMMYMSITEDAKNIIQIYGDK